MLIQAGTSIVFHGRNISSEELTCRSIITQRKLNYFGNSRLKPQLE